MPTSTTPAEVPEPVRLLAENPGAYGPAPPGFERIVRDGYCLFMGPMPQLTIVQRLRLRPEQVPDAVSQVRELAAGRGRTCITWWVGDSATPADLVDRLLAEGLVRSELPVSEPLYGALALVRPPAGASEGVAARRIESFEEFQLASEITHAAFGHTEEQRDGFRQAAPMLYELERQDLSATYLAFVEGEAVGSATAVFADAAVMLVGGATLPEARGRGCYRALVQARWDDAVRRGTPALVVQAGEMSRPILERLGFELVSELRVLLDELE